MEGRDGGEVPGGLRGILERQRSLCARVVVSWTLAGGITAGGFLLALSALSDPKSAGAVLPAAPVLFAMGASAGLAHGALLAYLGRPPDLLRRTALQTILLSGVSLLVGLPVALVVTGWVALGPAALILDSGVPLGFSIAAVIVGLVICGWAVLEGSKALRNAFGRWPEARAGTLLLSAVLAVLVILFHQFRPELWFTEIRVTGVGAILLAFVATLWIAAPVVILFLSLLHRQPPARTT